MTKAAVAAIQIIHDNMRTVLDGLADADWDLPSACAGWTVKDLVAHVTSNQKEVADPTPPPSEPMPAMKAEEAMEALVAPRKAWSPAEVRAEYDRYFEAWMGALGAMQDEPLASVAAPVADLGTYELHSLANAFAFDHYCHLRIDLLAPTGPLPDTLAPATDAEVRPGIEWMFIGLPQMQPTELAAVVSGPLGVRLTGAGGGEWTINPAGADGLVSVSEGISSAAATVTSSAHDFVRWGTQRCNWRECCTVEGDAAYAAKVLDTLNIV